MRTVFFGALALLPGTLAQAQRPDFAGTWIAARGATAGTLAAAPSPVMGVLRFRLALDATGVVLTRPAGDVSLAVTLPLGGAATMMRIPGRLCERERLWEESAAWEGDALVLTLVRSTPSSGAPATDLNNRRILRLQGRDTLVVEGTIVQQGQRSQVGSVYVRATDTLPALRAPLPIAGIPATIDQVAWIGATWVGTTNAITTEERWTPPASGGLIGVSRTLRGDALAGFEFLCIVERAGTLAYLAMPDARMPATTFVLTAISATSATFENPSHDFPKLIRYEQTPDGGLATTIAGAAGARPRTVTLKKAPGSVAPTAP